MNGKVDIKKLRKIRDNYPDTYNWMEHKANWEHMCMGAVLNNYSDYIEQLMNEEDKN